MSKEKKGKHFLHKPEYKGGMAAFKQFISKNIQYPEEALKAGIEGNVRLRYEINHKGVVTGGKVISGIGHGCDEEAIRLVKLLKFHVGKNRGVRTTFHKTITIHFKKSQAKKKAPPPSPLATTIQYNYTSSDKAKTKTKAEDVPKKSSAFSYNYSIPYKRK